MRTGEVIRVRFGGSARDRAFAELNRDLRRAARRSGTTVLTITDTSNRSVHCPELIPTLLDWYENVDAKARLRRLPIEALPVGIEDRVRSYLESEQEESRTQSRLLLERIAEQGRADG